MSSQMVNSTTNLSSISERVKNRVASFVERGDVPGFAGIISLAGESQTIAFGNQSFGGPPIQAASIFRIASISKPIFATTTMTLVEDGIITLDDPVERYLPELAAPRVLRRIDSSLDDTEPASRSITVRDLLTLTPGIGIVLAPPGSYPIQRAMTELGIGEGPPIPGVSLQPDEWIRRLGTLPLVYHPGERWLYHTGFDVLGVLLSRASGKSLEKVLSDRVFAPLGMVDTSFSVPLDKLNRFVTCYGARDSSGRPEVLDPAVNGQWTSPVAFASGGGGLVSTVNDCHAFATMLLNRGTHGTDRLLSEDSIDQLTRNHLTPAQLHGAVPVLSDSQGWGFGMAVSKSNDPLSGPARSYGWTGGLGTTWINDPSRRLVAILFAQVGWTSPAMFEISEMFLAEVNRIGTE